MLFLITLWNSDCFNGNVHNTDIQLKTGVEQTHLWQLLDIAECEREGVHELVLLKVRFDVRVRGGDEMIVATRKIKCERQAGN